MSGQWISHDPQVQADSSQPACQTGQSGRPHQELRLVDDMCLRCVVRVCRDLSSPRTKYRMLCVRVPAVHRPNLLGLHSRPDLLQSAPVLNSWCNRNLPCSSRPVGWLSASSQRLNGTSCCARQTGGHARKRKTQKFDIGTALQKRDEPGLVTATTTLRIPSGLSHY